MPSIDTTTKAAAGEYVLLRTALVGCEDCRDSSCEGICVFCGSRLFLLPQAKRLAHEVTYTNRLRTLVVVSCTTRKSYEKKETWQLRPRFYILHAQSRHAALHNKDINTIYQLFSEVNKIFNIIHRNNIIRC